MKLDRNVERDREIDELLRMSDWTTVRVWEHEDPVSVADKVEKFVRGRIVERTRDDS